MSDPRGTDGSCPFCDYASGVADPPGGELIVIDGVMEFQPLHPYVPGHILLAPVEHVQDIATAINGDDVIGRVMQAASRVVATLRGWGGYDGGVNVITSSGEAATQTVMHWHVHVIPRLAGDALGGWPWKLDRPESE